jgi:hypothetical protein
MCGCYIFADVTTTTGSYIENNRLPVYKHQRNVTNTRSGQLDDAKMKWKRDFINTNFKEKVLNKINLMNFN